MKNLLIWLLLLVAESLLLLHQGASDFSFLRYLFSFDHSISTGQLFILTEIRLPPIIAGIIAGFAFGLSGAIFQRQFRNPLASPDVLGVTSGASAAVLAVSVFNLEIPREVAAVTGSIIVAFLVFAFGWQRGEQRYKLIVSGLAFGYLATGITSYLLARSNSLEAAISYSWLVGSTRMATNHSIQFLLATIILAVLFINLALKPMQSFDLGNEKALTLGYRVNRWNIATLLTAVLLSAFATATVGPISFVALLAGPIAHRISRKGRFIFTLSAIIGANLIIFSDLLIALLFREVKIPTGLVTGLLGAVFLLAVVLRKRSEANV